MGGKYGVRTTTTGVDVAEGGGQGPRWRSAVARDAAGPAIGGSATNSGQLGILPVDRVSKRQQAIPRCSADSILGFVATERAKTMDRRIF